MFERIRKWWEGELINPNIGYEDGPYFMSYYQRPFLARCYETLKDFHLKHWQFIWGILAALVIALISK